MTRTLPEDDAPRPPSAYSNGPEVPPTDPRSADLVARLRAAGCVFAEDEAAELLRAAQRAGRGDDWLERAVVERVAGRPLELVLGEVVFGGLRLVVAPGTFVPRVRTELLVDLALEALPSGARVLDLCGGVGAVAAVVAARRPDTTVVSTDLDERASACARANLAPYEGRAMVRTGDLYAALPPTLHRGFDVVVANAPYVPTERIAAMPREARDHEPLAALDGGVDGTDLQQRVVAGALDWLVDGGRVVVECAPAQLPVLRGALASAGFTAEARADDERGAHAVVGSATAASPRREAQRCGS